jgi:hypothetical protein
MLHEMNREALIETVTRSLETMAFQVAEPVVAPTAWPVNPVGVSLSFHGCQRGRVEVIASREFTLMLAANVLGAVGSKQDALEKADDCMKELVHVVAGALMPRIVNGSGGQIHMSTPTLHSVDAECDWPALAASKSTQLFNADGHTRAARVVDLD